MITNNQRAQEIRFCSFSSCCAFMDLLLKLPDYLVTLLTTDWIELPDVGRPDGAVCNQKLRREFLAEVFQLRALFSSSLIFKRGAEPLIAPVQKWAAARQAHFTDIAVFSEAQLSASDFSKWIELIGSKVQGVVMVERDDIKWSMVCQHCPNLRSMQMGEALPLEFLRPLIQNCPMLERLNVYVGRERATKEHLACIATLGPSLKHLSIQCIDLMDELGLVILAEQCPNLLSLDFTHGSGVDELSLTAIGQHCSLMEELHFSDLMMEDAGIIAIAQGCPRLGHIDISLCDPLTDAALMAIITHCPCLTYLNIEHNHNFTDAPLLILAAHCPYIEEFHMDGHELLLITMIGVRAVVQGCRKLKVLSVPARYLEETTRVVQESDLFRPDLQVLRAGPFFPEDDDAAVEEGENGVEEVPVAGEWVEVVEGGWVTATFVPWLVQVNEV